MTLSDIIVNYLFVLEKVRQIGRKTFTLLCKESFRATFTPLKDLSPNSSQSLSHEVPLNAP